LSNVPDIHIQVHLNPARHGEVSMNVSISDALCFDNVPQMPLKKFLRYNLRPYLTFDEAGYAFITRVRLTSDWYGM